MYLKVEKRGNYEWLLNGGTIGVSLSRNYYFHQWMKENTNANNGKVQTGKEECVIQNFMFEGFTPVYECFGTKILDSSGEKVKYELSDDIRWFLFDGIKEVCLFSNDLLSIAVSWNKKDNTFTVYNNRYKDKKRIGVFDDMSYVFNLVRGYLPVKIEDRSKGEFCLDWSKVHNYAAWPSISSILGEIRSTDISYDIFEKRLGNIINRVMKNVEYFTDDNTDNPCGYKRDELKKHLISENSDDGRVGIVRFYFKRTKDDKVEPSKDSWIEFSFEDEDNLRISMYDGMVTASPTCIESIRVQRRVTQVNKDYTLLLYGRKNAIATETMSAYGNSNSLEEEALAYLPHLGVYTVEDITEKKKGGN